MKNGELDTTCTKTRKGILHHIHEVKERTERDLRHWLSVSQTDNDNKAKRTAEKQTKTNQCDHTQA